MAELGHRIPVHAILGCYRSLRMFPDPDFPDHFELRQKLVLTSFIFVGQEIPFQKTLLSHWGAAVDSWLIPLS